MKTLIFHSVPSWTAFKSKLLFKLNKSKPIDGKMEFGESLLIYAKMSREIWKKELGRFTKRNRYFHTLTKKKCSRLHKKSFFTPPTKQNPETSRRKMNFANFMLLQQKQRWFKVKCITQAKRTNQCNSKRFKIHLARVIHLLENKCCLDFRWLLTFPKDGTSPLIDDDRLIALHQNRLALYSQTKSGK